MMVGSEPSIAAAGLPAMQQAAPSDVGFLDAIGPAFRTENIVGSSIVSAGPKPSDMVGSPKVNPWNAIEGTEYEPYYENFAGAENQAQVDWIKDQIDRENADRRVLSDAGLIGFAAMLAAGVVDLPSLIPGGAAVTGIRGGVGALRVAGRTALVAGAEATAVEGVLQSQQQTRTFGESATAIGGSVILGGILGGAAGAILARSAEGREAFMVASKAIERELAAPSDLSAAARMRPEITDFALPSKGAERIRAATPGGLSFTDRLQKAQSPVVRQIGNDLIGNEYAFSGTDRLAMEPSVEAVTKVEIDKYHATIAKTLRDDFKAFLKEGGELTRSEYAERVSMAMRRGDEDPLYPKVSASAQRLRQSVVEPLKDQAIKLGKLPEDVKVTTAASYFTRMWDTNRIIARSDEFLKRLENEFAAGQKGDAQEIRGYARAMAEDVYAQLTGARSPTDTFNIVAKARGPLKERTLDVRDVDYEDFLISDAEFVLNRYSRIMSAENELTRKFGSADLADQIKEIRADYAKLRDAATTEKQRVALDKEMRRTVRSVEAARDMIRGTYQAEARAGGVYRTMQVAQTYNYVRALGEVVLSSLPDVFKLTMANGIAPVVKDALVPMIRNLRTVRVAQKKAGELAGIAEVLLNSRLASIADITDPYASRTPVESFTHWMGSKASTFSGMMHWNQFLKEISAYLAQNRMARMATKMTAGDERFLKRLKINSGNWARIKEEMAAHGSWLDKNVYDPGVENWKPEVAKVYAAALRAEADTVIVTPGIGDKVPLVEENWFLKPAMQFKAFALASHRKTLMVGVQQDHARFIQSALLMASMGMFVYWAKSLQTQGGPSDNPGTWIAEGIDRAGLFPIMMEMNNMAERFGLPGVYQGLAFPFGGDAQRASRYSVRGLSDALAGPTAGLVSDTATTIAAPFDGDITPGEVGAARRLVPFGRHPGIRQFLDMWAVPKAKEAVE